MSMTTFNDNFQQAQAPGFSHQGTPAGTGNLSGRNEECYHGENSDSNASSRSSSWLSTINTKRGFIVRCFCYSLDLFLLNIVNTYSSLLTLCSVPGVARSVKKTSASAISCGCCCCFAWINAAIGSKRSTMSSSWMPSPRTSWSV